MKMGKNLATLLVIAAVVLLASQFFKFGSQSLVGGGPGQPASTPTVTNFNTCKFFTVTGSTAMSGSTQGVAGNSVQISMASGDAQNPSHPAFYESRGWLLNSKSNWDFGGGCSSGSMSVNVCNKFPQAFAEQSFSNGIPTVGLAMFEQCPEMGSASGAYCQGSFNYRIYLANVSGVNCDETVTQSTSQTPTFYAPSTEPPTTSPTARTPPVVGTPVLAGGSGLSSTDWLLITAALVLTGLTLLKVIRT